MSLISRKQSTGARTSEKYMPCIIDARWPRKFRRQCAERLWTQRSLRADGSGDVAGLLRWRLSIQETGNSESCCAGKSWKDLGLPIARGTRNVLANVPGTVHQITFFFLLLVQYDLKMYRSVVKYSLLHQFYIMRPCNLSEAFICSFCLSTWGWAASVGLKTEFSAFRHLERLGVPQQSLALPSRQVKRTNENKVACRPDGDCKTWPTLTLLTVAVHRHFVRRLERLSLSR